MPKNSQNKRWVKKPFDEPAAARLARELNISDISATLLANRNITDIATADRFFYPTLEHLNDPFLMMDMQQAVDRIMQAIERKEKILIYGDYDVDGTTSTVILKKALQLIGADVSYYIPERLTEGYGLREDAMDMAHKLGVHLIISVDTGIRAQQVVEYANSLGLDVIITDHHLPEEGLPKARAVLNPKRPDCNYPEKNLAGVGVAFKLAQALLMKTEQARFVESFVKIAAIGTIADIVPLTGENRVIAKYGLAGLRNPKNHGLRALLDVVGLNNNKAISGSDVGFKIGPRINAVGRLAGASAAVDLFDAPDLETAMELALAMNTQNATRQQIEAETLTQALEQIENTPELREARVAVIAGEGWHRGVIGIVASKVVERLHRPTIIISIENGMGYGSGRSIQAFHLLNGLESCGELFERFGGHSHAAGVTLRAENIPELRRRLNAYAQTKLQPEDLVPVVPIDYELPLRQATLETFHDINRLEPFGSGNPQPTFATYGVQVVERPRVLKDKHLKMKVMQGGRWIDCIWWGAGEWATEIFAGDTINIAYNLSENDYNNNKHIQLILKDLKLQ
jgi:single-stranded-DNA-specific exonuclease